MLQIAAMIPEASGERENWRGNILVPLFIRRPGIGGRKPPHEEGRRSETGFPIGAISNHFRLYFAARESRG